jgi:nucleoside-diphosphate-sugar epimerase
VPIDESHPTVPINPYGWTKLAAERLLADFAHAYGLRYVTFRYFNAAGADPPTAWARTIARNAPDSAGAPLGARPGRSALGVRGRLPDARRHLRAATTST